MTVLGVVDALRLKTVDLVLAGAGQAGGSAHRHSAKARIMATCNSVAGLVADVAMPASNAAMLTLRSVSSSKDHKRSTKLIVTVSRGWLVLTSRFQPW